MSDTVILVHGLWMRGFALTALARRMSHAGFKVETYDYLSLAHGPEAAARKLRMRMRELAGTVHLVGHSLGGLVALEAVRDARELPPGRVVCLGSPLCGSESARRLAHVGGLQWLLGRSTELLCSGVKPWAGAREVGVIAGRVPLGLGVILHGLVEPHDGTVAVWETQLPGITAHTVVPATHTGLAFSEEVAQLAIRFLGTGAFAQASAAA
jgi:alpha-beta hydrolase superfamily lysophospholipase